MTTHQSPCALNSSCQAPPGELLHARSRNPGLQGTSSLARHGQASGPARVPHTGGTATLAITCHPTPRVIKLNAFQGMQPWLETAELAHRSAQAPLATACPLHHSQLSCPPGRLASNNVYRLYMTLSHTHTCHCHRPSAIEQLICDRTMCTHFAEKQQRSEGWDAEDGPQLLHLCGQCTSSEPPFEERSEPKTRAWGNLHGEQFVPTCKHGTFKSPFSGATFCGKGSKQTECQPHCQPAESNWNQVVRQYNI